MKRSTLISSIAFAFIMLLSTNVNAQKFSKLDTSPMDASTFPSSYRVSDKVVKIVYSRPQLKGRALNSLAPNGKVWRTGANESSEITFYKDVTFGGEAVKAGTYSFYTIPGDSEWTIILNSDINHWGSYSYNESNDVARVKGAVSSNDKSVEAFAIAFTDDGTMHLAWGTLRVAVPMQQ